MNMKKPISYKNHRRLAKVLTYRYNALVDAQICHELVYFVSHGQKNWLEKTKNSESQIRAQAYAEQYSQYGTTFLLGLAYNLYYANGLANWLYTKFFWPFLDQAGQTFVQRYSQKLQTQLTTKYFFQEFSAAKYLLSYWPTIVFKQNAWLQDFWQRTSLVKFGLKPASLSQNILQKTALVVQENNAKFNQQIAVWLTAHQDQPISCQKVKLLTAAANESGKKEQFLKTCAQVQRAAARWDRLYSFLVS